MNETLHIRPPGYRRKERLSQEQMVALTGALRDVIQRETSCTEEGAAVVLAVLASLVMDLARDDVEVMSKELQKIKNKIVSDFRTGRLRMTRMQ